MSKLFDVRDKGIGTVFSPNSQRFFRALPIVLSALAFTTITHAQVTPGAIYKVRNECSNKLLDVSGISLQDGAKVHLWEDANGANQRWKVHAADNGFVSLTAEHSGKALDVESYGYANGAQLIQWRLGNQPNQQWRLIDAGGGYYKLESRNAPGKMLDVNGAGTVNGTKIQLWADSAGCAKRWRFESVAATDPTAVENTLQTIIDDMTLPHEGRPRGVNPNCDWCSKPRVNRGNDATSAPGYRYMIPWGQVYEEESKNPATNTRVQLRNVQAYYLSKRDRVWRLLKKTQRVYGESYLSDYTEDISIAGDVRAEPDGTTSVTAGNGYNFHYWTETGRAAIDAADIAGIWTSSEARLILNNPNGPDDRAKSRYIVSMGGDYWTTVDAPWDHFKTNADIGIGRFKYVKNYWQTFNMTTLSAAELRANPPPIVANSIPTQTVKIMPLGDSLTQSSAPGWRGFLYRSLKDQGYKIDFVGTQYSKPSLPVDTDPDHEGHGGFTIGPGPSKADSWTGGHGNLYVNLEQYMATQPDIVLLMIGINDYWNIGSLDPNYQVERDGPGRLAGLIDKIHQLRPQTKVIVASLAPVEWDAEFGGAFSRAIPGIVATRTNTYFVDMRTLSKLTTGDFTDQVHFTESGDRKVAAVWLNAVKPVLATFR